MKKKTYYANNGAVAEVETTETTETEKGEPISQKVYDALHAFYRVGNADPRYLYLGYLEAEQLRAHVAFVLQEDAAFLSGGKYEGMEVMCVSTISHLSIGGVKEKETA